MADAVPSSETILFTLRSDEKQLRVTIADDKETPLAHALINAHGLTRLISTLMGFLSRMQAATNTAPLGQASGVGKLPAPTPFSRWVLAGETGTGRPTLAFEIAKDTWLSFALPEDDARKIAKTLLQHLDQGPPPELPQVKH